MKAFTQEVKVRFEIVQGDEQLSSHSGLALAGAILDRSSIRKRLDAVVLLRMSLQHAKVMSMILRRQLKTLEREAGVISLPPQLCSQLGVSLEDW